MILKRGFAIGLIALLLAPSMAFAQQSVNVEGADGSGSIYCDLITLWSVPIVLHAEERPPERSGGLFYARR